MAKAMTAQPSMMKKMAAQIGTKVSTDVGVTTSASIAIGLGATALLGGLFAAALGAGIQNVADQSVGGFRIAVTSITSPVLTITSRPLPYPKPRVVAGSARESLLLLNLQADSEPIDVTRLTIVVDHGRLPMTKTIGYTSVPKVYLYKSSPGSDTVPIGALSGYPLLANYTDISFLTGTLVAPTSAGGLNVLITGDLALIGGLYDRLPGVPNSSLTAGTGSVGMVALGVNTGFLAFVNIISGFGAPVVTNKAYPRVSVGTASALPFSGATFFQAKITAVGGDVAIYRLSFRTTTSTGVDLHNAYVRTASDSCSTCSIGPNKQISARLASGYDHAPGIKRWTLTVDPTQLHGQQYLKIPDGKTAVVDFVVDNFVGTNFATPDSVSTAMVGDQPLNFTNFSGQAAALYDPRNWGKFVWTDLWQSSVDVLTASQWYNGYLVEGLPPQGTPVTLTE